MSALANKKNNLAVQCLVAVIYFLLATWTFEFVILVDGKMIIWPAAGFALGVLLRLGLPYALGVFFGALAAGVFAGYSNATFITTALGDTLAPVLTVYLLRFMPFSASFYRLNDYLSLVAASCIGATMSTFFGANASIYSSLSPLNEAYGVLTNCWMSDVLGIVILTPLLLLYSPTALFKVILKQPVEIIFLIGFATIVALMVLMGWDFGVPTALQSSYLLTLPLIWSILRFGQIITALIVLENSVIGVWGLIEKQGFFVGMDLQANLVLFWAYFMVMALISLIVSFIVNERNMLYQAINHSQVGNYIFSGRDLQFEFINNAALNDLGVSFREALKLGPVDLKPLYDEQQFKAILTPLLTKERGSVRFETMVKAPGGEDLYPAEVHIQNIEHMSRDCYFASVFDISERLAKEQQLRLGNQVCELTPQAIMITNKDNLIIRVNKAFCDITGYQADEVLGHHPDILNSDRYNELFYEAFWNRLLDEKIWKGEVYSGRKDGSVYLQNLTIKLLYDEQGQIEHYLAMFTDITQQRRQALHFKQLAEFDHLTNLANRVLLQQNFQAALALAKRHHKQLAVLYIDLNDFKPINDTYGHAMGDIVLQHAASRMKACIRDSDTASRIGGDEFCILLNDLNDLAICQTMVEKLKQVIAEPITEGDITLKVSVSIGVANYPEQGDSLEALLNYADLSMYSDKEKMKQV
jgi:diguanylate cyclase (GGDEF)-like protein/PAS domain S-box-containing protein